MSPPVILHSWNMLRIYAKVDTCDWTGTFYSHVIGAHLFPKGSDIKEVRQDMVSCNVVSLSYAGVQGVFVATSA
jgi:hypothetical protein